jgi:hypothetical protein
MRTAIHFFTIRCAREWWTAFRVFLGNALAVDLSLTQIRFDHTPYHRRNRTARFSVGDAS